MEVIEVVFRDVSSAVFVDMRFELVVVVVEDGGERK